MLGKCQHNDCERPSKTKGYCQRHYMRLWRNGCTTTVRPPGKPGTSRKHPLYGAWGGMVNRCHNPNNSSYGRYGARGVQVCLRWRVGEEGRTGFECFLADMGERPEGTTLDRIDPSGGYTPGNCRWASSKQQRANITPESDQRMRAAARETMKESWRAGRIVSRWN